MKKYMEKETPNLGDLMKSTQLVLVNSNPLIDSAESLPPNIIDISGMQVKEANPIEKEIDEFLAKGKKGAILISLGTNMRWDKIGTERIEMFVKAFTELPDFNFLWKFETPESLINLPPNVKAVKWLKQNDVLAHSNIKAFITHAGLLSTHEATYFGIPMVCIPFFTDQFRNTFLSVKAGVGVKIDIANTSVKDIKEKVFKVVSDPKFKENSEVRSKLFKDRPMKPLELAVWWSEYILRNSNATHLKVNQFNFGLLNSSFWDIQFIILSIIFITIFGMKRFITKLCRKKKINVIKKMN